MNTASRYDACERLNDGAHECLGLRVPLDIAPRPDDRFHTVVAGDRLDHIAHRYFGNAGLWWVIADANTTTFPLELAPNTVLIICRPLLNLTGAQDIY